MIYFNEFDPYPAQWLRNLIDAGILEGIVDDRPIQQVTPSDLTGFEQCHFFAGIGGWAIALQAAQWTGPVWTGSCPCQPFSQAGKQGGVADDRHLWPVWAKLIKNCKPAVVFGEQVASKAGRHWLANVRYEMETLGYGVGAADLGAASVGAPHIRQRLWFVADATSRRLQERYPQSGQLWEPSTPSSHVVHTDPQRLQGRTATCMEQEGRQETQRPTGLSGGWSDIDWIACTDGKERPIEPRLEPLAHGIQQRARRLRAYGNAIVPQVATHFIKAAMEAMPQ